MKILLVQTGFLGDVVLSTPVIEHLAGLYPQSELSLLTTPAARTLVQHHPALKEVIVFDKRKSDSGPGGLWRMAQQLRGRKFDRVFSLHKSWRTAALLKLAGISERFGFDEAAARFLYTKTARRKDLPHEVLRNLAILRTVGVQVEHLRTRMQIHIPETAVQQALKLLPQTEQPLIGLAPGSVWATKRWEPAGFAEVARYFTDHGSRVVLLGGKEDSAAAAELERLAQCELVNLVGRCELLESAAIIDRLELLVTNDSAPLHIAGARETPVVAVFCATVPEFGFGPWETIAEVVGVSGLACRPCGAHGGNTCPTGTRACMKDLSAQTVIAACRNVQARSRSAEDLVELGAKH